METGKFWWIKTPQKKETLNDNLVVPKLDLQNLDSCESLTSVLKKESTSKVTDEIDVGSIIEEINRVAAQSPLGPFEKSIAERSIEDIMKEAERIYMESSKSFEQLSQRSKTSQNISELTSSNSKASTPTPKSISPLPIDNDNKSDYSSYSEDFSQESKIESDISSKESPKLDELHKESGNVEEMCLKLNIKSNELPKSPDIVSRTSKSVSLMKNSFKISPSNSKYTDVNLSGHSASGLNSLKNMGGSQQSGKHISFLKSPQIEINKNNVENSEAQLSEKSYLYVPVADVKFEDLQKEVNVRNKLIRTLEEDNSILKTDIQTMRVELEKTHLLIEKLKLDLDAKVLTSPEINLELERALEQVKDTKEINTSLQLQLDTVNKSHQLLKSSYDDLFASNKNMERKVLEMEATISKYKTELLNAQQTKDKLIENEINLNKLLDIEKLQTKSLKLQTEKDSKCIQDLNRQIKEMERIIARKHPDSVSALIVAAKEDPLDSNLSARRLLEDRIKSLEQEVSNRDTNSSKVFLEIQEKFNQMKNKYESHIEDLELHVSDLKTQLNRKTDTFDVYTQTFFDEKVVQKKTVTVGVQTTTTPNRQKNGVSKKPIDKEHVKEDAHLLATIRGLQADLSNKEKVISKLQKEIEECRKTNRRLQKEREGSLRSLSERKDFRSYPEKLASQSRTESNQDFRRDEELQQVRLERDRLKQQLSRLGEDYELLKRKRLDDLTALQEAHEREISNYLTSVTPLKEQLELQQATINSLQTQLTKSKEELAVVNAEKEHLSKRVLSSIQSDLGDKSDGLEIDALMKKVSFLEKRYEEREYRLRSIIQNLAQKTVSNQSCDQCAERQKQLISYKIELDQLLATVRALQ